MNLSELQAAAANNPAMRRTLTEIQNWMTQMEVQTGITPTTVQQGQTSTPPLADLTVTGTNGKFSVQITNPTGVTGALLHELKSSSTVPFSSSADIITHLAAVPDTSVVLDLPNSARYFQLRSRFQTSKFNNPQVLGPISSGSTASVSLTLLNTNYEIHTNPPTPIMVQPDVVATIRVLPVILRAGSSQSISYNGTTADLTVDDQGNPLTFDTYFVYADDPNKAGGTVTFKATLDSGVLSQNDARFSLGQITLNSNGGGLLFPNDISGGPIAGTVVRTVQSGNPVDINIETLIAGENLNSIDGLLPEILQGNPIAIPGVPCVTFKLSEINFLIVSADTQLQAGGGGLIAAVDANVGDMINTAFGQMAITVKAFGGLQTVYNLTLSKNRLFLANFVWCAD